MSRLKLNILANFAGQGWSALMQLAFVPLYLKFLGIEAYGLIGFYIMLQGALQVLDLGLSPTINREMARYSIQPEKAGEARDLVRTLEVGYWLIGIAIGAVVLGGAPWIAAHWIKARAIPVSDVQQAVMTMGVLVALQWPLSFYGSGLMGLQRQVLLNSVMIPLATLSSGGAVLVLWLVSPKITTFFVWQVVISGVQVAIVTILLWRSLPPCRRTAKFNFSLIRNVWGFAAGMGGISLSAIILTQLDKVILSKMLSLEMFGYYLLASVIGRCLYVVITPVFNAIFPRFTALVAAGDLNGLKELYHSGSQLMAVLVLPLAAVVALFSNDLLLLWIRDAETARNAAPIASLLVIGTALNGLMNLPYALQLAHGWTSIGLRINTFFIIILVPAIYFMTTHYGAVGAAAVWVTLNSIYMLIGVPLTHQRLLKGEAWKWFSLDVCPPLLAAALVVGVVRMTIETPMSPIIAFSSLSGSFLVAVLAATLASTGLRGTLLVRLGRVAATR